MRTSCMFLAVAATAAIMACGDPEFSPFETRLPEHLKSQTQKNLSSVEALSDHYDQSYAAQAALGNTAPLTFSVAVIADSHNFYDDLRGVVNDINARGDIAFVLVCGDMTNKGLRQEYEWFSQIMGGLRVPYLTVPGNHDALAFGREIYATMFGPFDYAFTFHRTRIIMLNTNSLEFPGKATDTGWLMAELAGSQDCDSAIVAAHIPPVEAACTHVDYPTDWDLRTMHTGSLRLVVSAHKHTGQYGLINSIAYASVPPPTGGRYSVVRVTGAEVEYSLCTPQCRVMN